MAITVEAVESVAPDQASLKAAAKLMKPAKWPVMAEESDGHLMWAECQGSGANPYRVAADKSDLGYKCTCPSRKFPCKHALALMWFKAEGNVTFQSGTPPKWVLDWVGRRRKTPTVSPKTSNTNASNKNLTAAKTVDVKAPSDPKAEARKIAAAKKRAETTEKSMIAATYELDQWIEDQLRTGLSGFLDNLTDRCRKIAARLVDGKAGSLAGRLDEMPSRILAYPTELRAEIALSELSKLVLLTQSFRNNPQAPDLRRLIGTTETRQQILDNTDTLRLKSRWEFLGEQVMTRRDGLVAQYSWLLNLEDHPQRFALLLDFFPASAGKRGGAANIGEQFDADLIFYPGGPPLRAVVGERSSDIDSFKSWPQATQSPLSAFRHILHDAPWTLSTPLLLPAGRILEDDGGRQWWSDGSEALPLANSSDDIALGMDLTASVGIWDGRGLTLISSQSAWGKLSFAA